MENLMCTGHEVDIALCKFSGWGKYGRCTHAEDVAITCGIDNYPCYLVIFIFSYSTICISQYQREISNC